MARGNIGATVTFTDTSEVELLDTEWSGNAQTTGYPWVVIWPTQSGTVQAYYVQADGTARSLGADARWSVTANEAASLAIEQTVPRVSWRMRPSAGSGTAVAEGGHR